MLQASFADDIEQLVAQAARQAQEQKPQEADDQQQLPTEHEEGDLQETTEGDQQTRQGSHEEASGSQEQVPQGEKQAEAESVTGQAQIEKEASDRTLLMEEPLCLRVSVTSLSVPVFPHMHRGTVVASLLCRSRPYEDSHTHTETHTGPAEDVPHGPDLPRLRDRPGLVSEPEEAPRGVPGASLRFPCPPFLWRRHVCVWVCP